MPILEQSWFNKAAAIIAFLRADPASGRARNRRGYARARNRGGYGCVGDGARLAGQGVGVDRVVEDHRYDDIMILDSYPAALVRPPPAAARRAGSP